MLTENCELRTAARKSLTNKWGMAVVSTLVYMVIAGVLSGIPLVGSLISLFVAIPMAWGMTVLFLNSFRGGEIEVGQLFDGFKDYGRVLGTMLLSGIYTFLWALLLIVPGIIKAYSYGMTPYILKDEPELKFNGAIEKSMAMMNGNKMKLFLLDLSFIGWALLSIITLGIGLLWLNPYMFSARAAFYEDLKREAGVAPVQA